VAGRIVAMKKRALISAFVLAAVLAAMPAFAAPPEHPDPALRGWFESLRSPRTGAPCCSVADCRPTLARRGSDGWEVMIDERFRASTIFWIPVPADKVLAIENPTGQAIACYLPEAGLMCFVPAPES
jgi:hypothetical protein